MFLKRKSKKPKTPKGFIEVTRLYGDKENGVREQPVLIQISAIEHCRPRNKIAGARSTIITKSGTFINIAETFSEVKQKLKCSIF